MEKMFEQTTKMMEQVCEQWRTTIGDSPFLPKTGKVAFQTNMTKWIESMNSTYASNMEAWNKLIQQNEELFFKMFRQAPVYNETAENTMRGAWSAIVKAQKAHQDLVRDSLAIIENSLKESQDKG